METVVEKLHQDLHEELSHLAGMISLAQQRETVRVAGVATDWPASPQNLDILVVVTTTERAYVGRRTPKLLPSGDCAKVRVQRWKEITPTYSPVVLAAGMEIQSFTAAPDGSAVIQVGRSTYYVPGGVELMSEQMILSIETPAQQLTMPQLNADMAVNVATLLCSTPASGPRYTAELLINQRLLDIQLGDNSPTLRTLFKGPVPSNDIIELPGLRVILEPPRGKK